MLRTVLLALVLVSVAAAATLVSASSFCTVVQNGSTAVDNHFNSLLPAGRDTACPGVEFTRSTLTIVHAVELAPGSYADFAIEFIAENRFTVYLYPEIVDRALNDPKWLLTAGQSAVLETRETYTISRPPGVTADVARLNVVDGLLYWDSSCFYNSWTGCSWDAFPTMTIGAPAFIRYGAPFEVVYTFDLKSLGIRIPASLIPGPTPHALPWQVDIAGQWRLPHSGRLVATPIPEPSTALLVWAALLGTAIKWAMRGLIGLH
jgi:hypothetical protein